VVSEIRIDPLSEQGINVTAFAGEAEKIEIKMDITSALEKVFIA
jgi:hypothetical protein